MARIRTYKPDWHTSGKQLRLSDKAALLVLCLWSHADDEGRLKDDPLEIGARFPRAPQVVPSLLEELVMHGWIERYEADGHKVIQVHDWQDHQSIDRPRKSTLPKPIREDSTKPRGGLDEGSMGIGKEGKERKGMEGKGSAEGKGATSGGGSPLPGETLEERKAAAKAFLRGIAGGVQ